MPRRIIIYGNAGSGKTTLARKMAESDRLPILALDRIAWGKEQVRRPLRETLDDLQRFMASSESWIIEGCYGDLIEAAVPSCTELHLLNPGVETCVARCRARPWDPDKFADAVAQAAMLETLLAWVRQYPTRDDEFGLARHRAIFDRFTGRKFEHG